MRAQLRDELVKIGLAARDHLQDAHLFGDPAFYQRYRMTYGERHDFVSLPDEQRIAQLVLRGEYDLPGVVVSRREVLQKDAALPQCQLALVWIERRYRD